MPVLEKPAAARTRPSGYGHVHVCVCVCVCVHVSVYVLRAVGAGRQLTGCGGRTAASALEGGHRASGRRATRDWRR